MIPYILLASPAKDLNTGLASSGTSEQQLRHVLYFHILYSICVEDVHFYLDNSKERGE